MNHDKNYSLAILSQSCLNLLPFQNDVFLKYLKQEVDVCQNSGKKQLLQSTGHCTSELHSLVEIHGKLFGNITYLFCRKSSPNYPDESKHQRQTKRVLLKIGPGTFPAGKPRRHPDVSWGQRL